MKFRNKLKDWRKHRGLTQDELADKSGFSKGFISLLENGHKQMVQTTQQVLAQVLDTSEADLMSRAPHEAATSLNSVVIPITGKVAAGIDGHYHSDYEPGDSGNDVTFDPEEISLALRIEGDSMKPRYRNGETVLFGYRYDDPTPWVRREVFAQLTDGRKLFKTLMKGSRKGYWDLYSLNTDFDPIRDVELAWVSPVKWHAV